MIPDFSASIVQDPDTGLFTVFDQDHDPVQNFSIEEGAYVPDPVSDQEADLSLDQSFTLSGAQEDPLDLSSFDGTFDTFSVAPSSSTFSVQAWQLNIASNRFFGQHYLIWADRVYSGNQSYLIYYTVIGNHIKKEGDLYLYDDAQIYSFYSFASNLSYDVSPGSGSVSGSSNLVYSDLYFDYVGSGRYDSLTPFITFIFGFLIFVVLLRRNRNV